MFLRLFVVVSLSFCIGIEGQVVDLNRCPNLAEETKECVKTHPLDFISENEEASSILDIFSKNSTFCSSKDQFLNLMLCVSKAILKCVREDLRGLTTSEEGHRSSLEYYCNKINEFDPSCLLSLLSMDSFTNCVKDNAVANPSNTEYETLKEYVCKTNDVNIKCVSTVTLSNDDKCYTARAVFVELMKKEIPPACGANGLTAGVLLVVLISLFSLLRSS